MLKIVEKMLAVRNRLQK